MCSRFRIDYVVWFVRDIDPGEYRQLFLSCLRRREEAGGGQQGWVEQPEGARRLEAGGSVAARHHRAK